MTGYQERLRHKWDAPTAKQNPYGSGVGYLRWRDVEFLRLLAHGVEQLEAGKMAGLGDTRTTIAKRFIAIRELLGMARNGNEAVALAIAHGIIAPDEALTGSRMPRTNMRDRYDDYAWGPRRGTAARVSGA